MSDSDNDLRAKALLSGFRQRVPGMSDRDIGKLLGISYGRVYQLRLRAIAKIRQAVLDDPLLRELAEEVCGHNLLD